MLADDVKHLLNEEFAKSNIPLKINYLVLYRPVFNEPPFENLEVIDDPKRFMVCNVVHMVITMRFGNHDFEVELRYKNNNGKFTNEWCQMQACDILLGEDHLKVQDSLSETAKLTGLILISTIAKMPEKKG